jgi:hypothetical protein
MYPHDGFGGLIAPRWQVIMAFAVSGSPLIV